MSLQALESVLGHEKNKRGTSTSLFSQLSGKGMSQVIVVIMVGTLLVLFALLIVGFSGQSLREIPASGERQIANYSDCLNLCRRARRCKERGGEVEAAAIVKICRDCFQYSNCMSVVDCSKAEPLIKEMVTVKAGICK